MTLTNPTPGAYCPLNYCSSTSSLVLVDTGNFPAATQDLVQTWNFNGTNWSLIDATLSGNPTLRDETAACFDGTNLVLSCGKGLPSTGYFNDSWSMASNFLWTNTVANNNSNGLVIGQTAGLTVRTRPYMAAMTGGAVLWGGSTAYYMQQDMYSTTSGSGGVWNQLFPTTLPPVRDRAANASNSTSQFVVWSGAGTNSLLLDGWVFNGTSWSSFSASGQPSARKGAAFCWVPSQNYWLLFGGSDSAGNCLLDTYTLNAGLTAWAKISTPNAPSAREGASLAYLPGVGAVLWGGKNQAFANGQSWLWNTNVNNWIPL